MKRFLFAIISIFILFAQSIVAQNNEDVQVSIKLYNKTLYYPGESLDNPIYVIDDVSHYAVDHTPSMFYKTISSSLSEIVSKTIDMLITDCDDEVLTRALIVKDGVIIDQRINQFQQR